MGSPITPLPADLRQLRRSFRRRQWITGLAFVAWVAAMISNVALRPSLVWIAAAWVLAAIAIMGFWRCPRCGELLGRSLFPVQCPHCYLRFYGEAPVHEQPNER
jgi:hypothetical protein